MLTQLRIQNLAIISTCELHFRDGLIVLSGETGAGKSIIIDAISLLLGKPAQEDLIKTGEDEAFVEGLFTLYEPEKHPDLAPFLDDECQLIVFRKISRSKSNIARVNNQSVTLKQLKKLMSPFVTIAGQHDYMQLFNNDYQRDLLDAYGSEEIIPIKAAYKDTYKTFQNHRTLIKKTHENQDTIQRKIEFLDFQISDIDQYQFQKEEEVSLKEKRDKMRHADSLNKRLFELKNISDQLNQLYSQTTPLIEHLEKIDPYYHSIRNILQTQSIEINDIEQELTKRQQESELLKEENIDNIEKRLDDIFHMKQKYKVQTLQSLCELYDHFKKERETLSNQIDNKENLEKDYQLSLKKINRLAKQLHQARKKAASQLESEFKEKLHGLQLGQVNFKIELSLNIDQVVEHGSTNVLFTIATNPGEPLKPLQKIASGGELSRLMLALHTVMLEKQPVPTIIFDEIDTGVGGLVANKIGDYLKLIASHRQVLCVTHLAQIASKASRHYVIKKHTEAQQLNVSATLLAPHETQAELERMLGGKELAQLLKKEPSFRG